MFEENDKAPTRRASKSQDRVRCVILPCVEEPEVMEETRDGEACVKVVSIDMCGLLMDVCGSMLGVGY